MATVKGKPFVLTKRGEEILRVMHFYRYMTAQDVCWLLFSPSSLTHVRQLLTDMSGGGDGINNQYLYRFALPSVSAGNPRRVYTLGNVGREFLTDVTGLEVNWYFRPHKVKHLSFSKVLHNLFLTRFLVCARRWASLDARYELVKTRTCYEFEDRGERAGDGGKVKRETAGVIPDGWLLFARRKDKVRIPVLLEIDRGTAYRVNFKRHVRSRVEYIKSGEYSRTFGEKAVMIAYVTTGETAEYRESRLRAMCSWTMEVLKELGAENWAPVFRFSSLSLQTMYDAGVFEEPVWYRADVEKPVRLFGG